MSTLGIIIWTVVATLIVEIILIAIFSYSWGEKHINRDLLDNRIYEWNPPNQEPVLQAGWEKVSRDENGKLITEIIWNTLMDIPDDTHEEYLGKLEEYKKIIDESPNKFLGYHLKTSLNNEQYELAQYIKDVAKKREFKLIPDQ